MNINQFYLLSEADQRKAISDKQFDSNRVENGESALHRLCTRDMIGVRLLIEAKADIEFESRGETALEKAVVHKNFRECKQLLDHGARIHSAKVAGRLVRIHVRNGVYSSSLDHEALKLGAYSLIHDPLPEDYSSTLCAARASVRTALGEFLLHDLTSIVLEYLLPKLSRKPSSS